MYNEAVITKQLLNTEDNHMELGKKIRQLRYKAGLTQEQLNAKIHETFDLVRESVEAELHGNATPQQHALLPAENNANTSQGASSAPQQNKTAYAKRNGTTSDAPASPKQVKYLLDLARQYGVSPDQIKAKFNVPSVESLTKTQCSRAIDELSGKAA